MVKQNKLKAYMGYSSTGGSCEGAILVFAYSSKQARVMTWKHSLVVDEYLDTAVKWLKDAPWLFKLTTSTEPHIIDSLVVCKQCEQWGPELNMDGVCIDCIELKES